jgi:hypothetical protein
MNCKSRELSTAVPQLLAKRWQESREHTFRNEEARRAWLQAAWLHPPGDPGLEMRWRRSRAANHE